MDDPGEEKNLYGLPEYKKLVTQLKGRMEKWFCTYSDPAIDGVRSAVNGPDSSAVRGCMQFMRIPLHQRAWNDYELFVKE